MCSLTLVSRCAGLGLDGKAEQVWVPGVNHRTSPDPSSAGELRSLFPAFEGVRLSPINTEQTLLSFSHSFYKN